MPFFDAVFQLVDAMLGGAVRTTIENSIGLHAMPDDPTGTVGTGRSQCVDGAFKAVEYMRFTAHAHFKTFIVRVAAYFTSQIAVFHCVLISIHDLPLS
ncbi:MAG TPA: hypothetical protein VFQ23_16815 [Anaerolineales bacterium]|nr:hypothetical protein [Anaerolineales bacterium]